MDSTRGVLDMRVARFRSDPESEDPVALGRALLDAGRYEDCRGVTDSALRRAPHDPELRLAFAQACFRQRDLLRAQAVLLEVLDSRPDDPDAYRWLGEVFLKRGDPARACKALERAAGLSSQDDPELERLMLRAQRLLAIASGEFEAAPAPRMTPTPSRPASPERATSSEPAAEAAPSMGAEAESTPRGAAPAPVKRERAASADVPSLAREDASAAPSADSGGGKAPWIAVALMAVLAIGYAGWRYGMRSSSPPRPASASQAERERPVEPVAAARNEASDPATGSGDPPRIPAQPEITREAWLGSMRKALEDEAPAALQEMLAQADDADGVLHEAARGIVAALKGNGEVAIRHLAVVDVEQETPLVELRARAALRLSDEAFVAESHRILRDVLDEVAEPSSQAASLARRLRGHRAGLALADGRAEDALAVLEPVVSPSSRDASLLTIYGDALYTVDRVDAAAGAYNRALEIDPELPDALLGRARTEVRADKHEAAIERLERSLELLSEQADPRRAAALTLLGRALLQRRSAGDRDRARRLLARAAAHSHAPADAYFWLGEAHAGRNVGAAVKAYRRYLEAAPEGEYTRRARRALRR